jgi:hypothetical protein
MSENAGRWNKGLTKETDVRVASAAEKMQGRASWNKGQTADVNEALRRTAEKLKTYAGDARPWDNGLAANLTLTDFKPFMDSEGRVDHRAVMEFTGISWPTVRGYIVDLGLAQTRRYIENRVEEQVIAIPKEELLKFTLGNGKVAIGKAMVGLGHAFKTIQRECAKHGLPTYHRHIRQDVCLNAVSVALGGVPYEEEWRSRRFMSAKNAFYRFDGYFPSLGLVVEFQGYQHYTFPNAYMPDESYEQEYLALRERDRIKRELVQAAPDLIYFEVTEEEPYNNSDYLKGRLVQMGVLLR